MKRLGLAFALVVALSCAAVAQIGGLMFPGPGPRVASVGCSDTNATAWVNAVVTAGGTVSGGQQTNVCNLIVGLKAASLYSTVMDRIWLFAAENTQQANIDIVNLSTNTPNSSPTFTANTGYASATGGFIDTNFVPSTAGGHYSLNSATFGYCNLTNSVASNSDTAMGVANLAWIIQNQSGSDFIDVNDAAFPTIAALNHQGLWLATRTGTNSVAAYRNSSATPVFTGTAASSSNPTVSFFVLASNSSGSVNRSTPDQIAAAFLGGGLISSQAAAFSALLSTYLAAVGTSGC